MDLIKMLCWFLGVYGKDDKEASLIDMMDDSLQDLLTKYVKLIYQTYVSGEVVTVRLVGGLT